MKNNSSVIDMCRYTPSRFVFFKHSLVYELVSDSLAFAVAETFELDDYMPEYVSEELIISR